MNHKATYKMRKWFMVVTPLIIAVAVGMTGKIAGDQIAANGKAFVPPNLPKTVTPPNSDNPPDYWGCRRDIEVHINKDFADKMPWRIWRTEYPNIAICVVGTAGRHCTAGIKQGKAFCQGSLDCIWRDVPMPNQSSGITVEIVNIALINDELIDQDACDVREGICRLQNSVITFSPPLGQRYAEDDISGMIMARHAKIKAGGFSGSGVLIDGQTVLTAWHVVENKPDGVLVTSALTNDVPMAVTAVRKPFSDVDLAILTLERPIPNVRPVDMLTDPGVLKSGSQGTAALRFIAVGHAMGYTTDDLAVKCSNPIGSFSIGVSASGTRSIQLRNHSDWLSKPGMSGSGVYTANGELVGLHIAAPERGKKLPDGSTSGGYDHPMFLAPNPVLARVLGAKPL